MAFDLAAVSAAGAITLGQATSITFTVIGIGSTADDLSSIADDKGLSYLEKTLGPSIGVENVKTAKLIFSFIGSKTDAAKFLTSQGMEKDVALVSMVNSQGQTYYGILDLKQTIENNTNQNGSE